MEEMQSWSVAPAKNLRSIATRTERLRAARIRAIPRGRRKARQRWIRKHKTAIDGPTSRDPETLAGRTGRLGHRLLAKGDPTWLHSTTDLNTTKDRKRARLRIGWCLLLRPRDRQRSPHCRAAVCRTSRRGSATAVPRRPFVAGHRHHPGRSGAHGADRPDRPRSEPRAPRRPPRSLVRLTASANVLAVPCTRCRSGAGASNWTVAA